MFQCDNCDYKSKKFFGLCPSCGEGMGVEIQEKPLTSKKKSKESKEINNYKIGKSKDKISQAKVVKETQFKDLNKVLSTSGGFVEHQVAALGAQPGVGKSTLCAQLCSDNSLYISTEESFNQVVSRFQRVNPEVNASIVSETDLDTIIHILMDTTEDFVIIDSLNSINNGSEGYTRQAANLSKITSILKENGKCGIIINQVTKSGGITGMNTVLHTVDTVLYLEKSEISDLVVASSEKNRFGAVGSVSIFEHEESGLEETKDLQIKDMEDTTGVTFSNARFGFKKMDIVIEALVAPSSMNYGLRRTYGISQPRMQQIIGVLASNSMIDFASKDIYVSISNGLKVDDTNIDLAIANSILSSYYKVPSKFEQLNGTMSLNGSVRKSDKMKHVRDLLAAYKRRQ